MTTLTSTARRTARWTPVTIAAVALALNALFMVLINLFMNRPDHDDIASTDLYVGGLILFGSIVVLVASRLGWADGNRCAKAALTLAVLVVLATPVWYSLLQPTLGVGAAALALRAREMGVRTRSTTVVHVLGLVGILVGVAFVLGTFVHLLTV